MIKKLILIFVFFYGYIYGQNPGAPSVTGAYALTGGGLGISSLLVSDRYVNWNNVGFTIPSYSINCATQLTGGNALVTGSGAAPGNTTKIQTSIASCDATHNVVSIPAGTWYFAGLDFGGQSKVVVRGAGANSTFLIFTDAPSCAGLGHGVCMIASNWTYSGDATVQPGGGNACSTWSAGYTQGSTTVILDNCGRTPPLNQTMILDQANDTTDTNGVYMCDGSTSNCTYEGSMNADGRIIGGVLYSTQQEVLITGVSGSGTGPYTVTISPGLYNTNIRSGPGKGAWFPGFVQNDGIENVSMDVSAIPGGAVNMFSCYQCWVKGTRMLNGERSTVLIYQSSHSVVRDSYFYGAQFHGATSYNIEFDESSDNLIENNIIQQVTVPLNLNGSSVGNVIAYNFVINDFFGSSGNYFAWPLFSHATANNFNLFEGNSAPGFESDNASGPADQVTLYRNLFTGYEPGKDNQTVPIQPTALSRNFNAIGNILGQPSFSNSYQQFPTSTTVWTGTGNSIYSMGSGGTGGTCSLNPGSSTLCDPLTKTSIMRWANYDVVTAGIKFDTTEASPAGVTYVAGNFTSGYFNTLAHTLTPSFYYSSKPSWWPISKAWPPIGPDVSTGNLGICTGTYAGWQATTSGQCSGGTLNSAWSNHVNSIPAQDCYLSILNGPPDGSGAALAFDAVNCY